MTTPRYRVQITLRRSTNLAEDEIVNVMHFEGDDDSAFGDREHWLALAQGLGNRIETFYQQISNRLADTLQPTGTIDMYDMRDPKPRIPRFTRELTLGALGTGSLPAEVAVVLSMRGALEPGVIAARRRGRIYIGPFANTQSGNTPLAGDSRPSDSLLIQILDAADIMATGMAGAARLAVYSPTTDTLGTGLPDEAWNDVVLLWADDAWDTQRRRGASATKRLERTV